MPDGMEKNWREDGGTILQFGAGNFLRAFVDLFVQEMNERRAGQPRIDVVVVQSTEGERARLLNECEFRYRVAVRGQENGAPVERVQLVESISAAYVAQTEWAAVRDVARSRWLLAITSNTTEAGLALDDADNGWKEWSSTPPRSFPARLLALLYLRHRAGRKGVTILPCELIANNADSLQKLVLEQATRWGWDKNAGFMGWLTDSCTWANTLVDRIVSGKPGDHPLLAEDPLLTVCEPYEFWAVENKPGTDFLEHPAICRVPDVTPYALRKVRILNGAHTALLEHIRRIGRTDVHYVREAVSDPEIGGWVNSLLFEEIVPTITDRVPDAEGFARQTLERFANPFLDHRLSDIALHHETKVGVRLVPTYEEFQAKFGRKPEKLGAVL